MLFRSKFNLKDVKIEDFYDKLPKTQFSLLEWIQFVDAHPEYLTINSANNVENKRSINSIAMSISRGLENIKDTVTPLEILQEKFCHTEIIKRQKREFYEIYTACLAAENFEITKQIGKDNVKFKLVSDLLMIYKDYYKIYVPPSLIGILLSLKHLFGHKGLTRMLAELQSYYFENMHSVTKQFIQCCYACFLTNKGTRKTKIGIYPTPSYPFEEVMMDLAENLNPINGYSHLLIMQCVFTDFVIIVPLKSKSAPEITRAILNSAFQQFNIRKVHSDNGPGFRSIATLEAFAALNIQVIASAALHPEGRGQIERLVGTIKLMLKRMLAVKSDLNWEYLPYLCAKILNNSISPKTNFRPMEMVFGSQGLETPFLDTENIAPPHYLVKNNQNHIDQLTKQIKEMTRIATEKLTELRLITNEKINKNRIKSDFKVNDFCFVLDRTITEGAARPLRTRFSPSPYVVVRPLWRTTLVRRLSDNFTTLYQNDDIKKFDRSSPLFSHIPAEISKVLLHDFQELLSSDLTTIAKYDPMGFPNGIQLFDATENTVSDPVDSTNIPIFPLENNEDITLEKQDISEKVKPISASENIPDIPEKIIPESEQQKTQKLGNEQQELDDELEEQQFLEKLSSYQKNQLANELLEEEELELPDLELEPEQEIGLPNSVGLNEQQSQTQPISEQQITETKSSEQQNVPIVPRRNTVRKVRFY